MAITNGYITADEALAYLRLSDQVDRLLVEGWVEAASRSIDRYCMRRFYADDTPTARTFTPTEWTVCTVDDIASTSGLVVRTDEDDDGVYERHRTVGLAVSASSSQAGLLPAGRPTGAAPAVSWRHPRVA
jgi:hypothetical protein